MPDFNFQMTNTTGAVVEGSMSALDEVDLAARVRAQGGVLLSVKASRGASHKSPKISSQELITFTEHLITSLQSGIPILTAIQGYAEQAEDPATSQMLNQISLAVEGGQPLSKAMGMYPKIFTNMYCNMVAAGEASGQLDNILKRLAEYLEWRTELAQDLRQATIYPAVVLSLVLGLIVFLLAFVLPRFTGIFEGATMELPLATRILMGAGSLFSQNWPILLGIVAATWGTYKLVRRNEKGDLWLERKQLDIPLIGKNIRYICMSQMTYSLGLLIGAGVNITQAMELSRGAVSNRYLMRRMVHVADAVNAGQSLTEAFKQSGQLPGLALQMIAVGEQSGSLAEALERCTEYLRKVVQNGLSNTMRVLEPAITLFLGVVVGGIALTIFYTLYKMIMSVGGAH